MDPAATQLEKARDAILACDYEAAVSACRNVLAQYPKHVEATCLLAEAYREQGRHGPAEDLLRRALSADPENILARWALGLLLRDQGREEEAFRHLVAARELAPGNSELVNDMLSLATEPRLAIQPTRALLGRHYFAGGLYARAADEFRWVLQQSPDRLDVWVGLAEALWRAGEHDEAREVCEAILVDAPHCLKALGILARLRRADGEEEAAQELLTQVSELDPGGKTLSRLA